MRYKLPLILLALTLVLAACDSKESDGEEATTKAAESATQPDDEQAEERVDDSTAEKDEKDEQEPAEPRSDQSFSGLSEKGVYVEITPEPNPIPFQELFELEIRVLDAEDKETPLEDVEIDQVRATMPAHNHGMKVKPEIEKVEDGLFIVEGMKFHMQGPGEHGRWVIEAVLNDGGTVDRVSYDVQCCAD